MKGFRTAKDFVADANTPPEQVMIDPKAETVTVTPPVAADDDSLKEPEIVKPRAAKRPPWADANNAVITGYNFRMNQELHQKLLWISENVPKHSSIQKTLMAGVEKYVDEVLKKWYKS